MSAACCARRSSASSICRATGCRSFPMRSMPRRTRRRRHRHLYAITTGRGRALRRHSIKDAEAYDHYAAEISRQCRFIKPLLMMTPPDPDPAQSLRPEPHQPLGQARRPGRLPQDRRGVRPHGREARCTRSSASGPCPSAISSTSISRIRAGRASPPPPRSSARRSGPIPPAPPMCCCTTTWARWTARSAPGALRAAAWAASAKAIASAATEAGVEIRTNAEVDEDHRARAAARSAWRWRTARRSTAKAVVSNLDPKRTYLKLLEKVATRRHRSRHPPLCQELQDPRLLGQAQHRARRVAAIRRAADGSRLGHHRYRRRLRLHRARLRRLQIRLLVEAALPRHRDPDHGRSDHGPAGQAFHVGLRAIRALQAGRGPVDADRRRPPSRRTCWTPIEENAPGFRKLILHMPDPHALGHRERGRADRGQYLPGRADPGSAAVQPSVPRLWPISRPLRRLLHVRLRHPSRRRRHGRARRQRGARDAEGFQASG